MQEKHAVLLLVGLVVAGHAIRLLLTAPGTPPGQILAGPSTGTGPAAHRDRAIRLARPLSQTETIDLNTAPAEEIARLPRIGMSLAKRIVAFRVANGGFGTAEELERVAGVGPALVAQLQGKVSFSGPGPPPSRSGSLRITQQGASSYTAAPRLVNLNSASLAELDALPGIGPARARAILAYRRDKGPFAAVSDLRAVPGLTRSVVKKISGLVTVR
jgi:competence protein ComEA